MFFQLIMPAKNREEHWFIADAEDSSSTRINRDLGLTKDKRQYRELTVPGIAGVWYPEQICWALLGISIAEECHLSKIKAANGIEALACKLRWSKAKDKYSMSGSRAFNRDGNAVWSFKKLSSREHYVQNTYRGRATSALSTLTLVNGTRFNRMTLTQSGEMIVSLCLTEGRRRKLREWCLGHKYAEKRPPFDWLNDVKPYRENLKKVLRQDIPDARRRMLLSIIEKLQSKKGILRLDLIKDGTHRHDVETAIAFDKMLDGGWKVLEWAAIHKECRTRITQELVEKLDILKKAARSFAASSGEHLPASKNFADSILRTKHGLDLLRFVVKQDCKVLRCDGDVIKEGNLFDHYNSANASKVQDEDMHDETVSTREKFNQLKCLWDGLKGNAND